MKQRAIVRSEYMRWLGRLSSWLVGLLIMGGLAAWVTPAWGASRPPQGILLSSDRRAAQLPTETPTATPSFTPTPTHTGTPPTATPTYTLGPTATPTASGTATLLPTPTGTTTAAPTATPLPPQILVFKADRTTLTAGEGVTLYWQVNDAATVILRSPEGEIPIGPVGNLVVQPLQNANYTLVARNATGETAQPIDLFVNPAAPTPFPPPPTVISPLATPGMGLSPTLTLPTTLTMTNPLTQPGVDSGSFPPPSPLATPVSPLTVTTPFTLAPSDPLPTAPPVATDLAPIALATLPALAVTPAANALAQIQLLTFFGGVAIAVVAPLAFLLLGALLWMVRSGR